MDVQARIAGCEPPLSPAERRVAAVVVDDPRAVAFGTVAAIAQTAGTGAATVVRLSAKLGFDGFSALQRAVRDELSQQLAPASERIREPAERHVLERVRAAGVDDIRTTLEGVDRTAFAAAIRLLARPARPVAVLSGDAASGIAAYFAHHLAMLRPGVEHVDGNEVRVARRLATFDPRGVLVVLDLRRYDRWVLDAAAHARETGMAAVVLSDGPLSPLAHDADVAFAISAAGPGPFDSHLGALALVEALLAGVAGALRTSATERLDRIERAWLDADALVEG